MFIGDASGIPLANIGVIPVSTFFGGLSSSIYAVTLSPAFPLGTFSIVLRADLRNQVRECNESNNDRVLTFTVTALAARRSANSHGGQHR